MEQKRDLAIVLRTVPFEDRHRVITALSEHHGRLTGVARNSVSSKRFGGALEPFTASEWHFVDKHGSEMSRLDRAEVRFAFEGIRRDFEKLSLASAFSEIAIRLAQPGEPCPELFRLHSNALMALETLEVGSADIRLLNAYLIKALRWSGNAPLIHKCLECSTPLVNLEPFAGMRGMADLATAHVPEGQTGHVAGGTYLTAADAASMVAQAEASALEHEGVQAEPVLGLIADGGWICPACRRSGIRHAGRTENRGSGRFTVFEISPLAMMDCYLGITVPIRQAKERFVASLDDHVRLFSYLEALLVFHVPGFDRTPMKSLRFLGLDSNLSATSKV